MLCKNCGINESIKYSKYTSGEFCSKKCSSSFSTKGKRDIISKKVSESLMGHKHSDESKRKMSINNGSHKDEVKMKIKNSVENFYKTDEGKEIIEKLRERMTGRIVSDETRKKIGIIVKKRCENVDVRIHMGLIGMNSSSWGITGITVSGKRYESLFEKKCFDYLDLNKIEFNEHKFLPNSSKMTDIYIEKFNMWIELDGVGRKRRQDFLKKKYGNSINDYWETKMLEYDKNELNLKVFTCFSDFKNFITSLYK